MGEQGRICEVCANTDFAFALDPSRWAANWYKLPRDRHATAHQSSFQSLRASALQGCPVCLFFMKALKLPLEPQEPEGWNKFEAKDTKKEKKKAKKQFDADRSREKNSGPCLISGIMVYGIHREFSPPYGVVAGFKYGPGSFTKWGVDIGVIPSEDSPINIGTRNLLHHTDIGLCRQWLQECQVKHAHCPPLSKSDLPTRLIDVGVHHDDAQPRLVVTRGQKGTYVTLSHCWGRSKPPATTRANLSSRMASIPMASMPKTFRDAVDIVRSLGYRYLWIDSFCIIQDDDADWQHECASMAKVYSDCVVTLASPDARDCHAGFPRGLHPTPTNKWCNLPVHWLGTTKPDSLRLVHPYDTDHGRVDWDNSPLAKRAWVFQERLLSPRWIYFGTNHLYFECTTAQFDEHLRVPQLSSIRAKHYSYAPKDTMSFRTHKEGLHNWYRMLKTYSQLSLTHGSDRLPALSGIVTRFAQKFDDEYVAGLWRKDLVYGLIYMVDTNEHPRPRSLHPSAVRGPSWSWYTCDRGVFHYQNRIGRFTVKSSAGIYDRAQFTSSNCFGPLIEIISAQALPLGENCFGEVRDARLTILGNLQSVWYSNHIVYSHEHGNVIGRLMLDWDEDLQRRESTKIFMLPLAIFGRWKKGGTLYRSWYALGLVKDMIKPDTYIRIGLIHEHDETRLGVGRKGSSTRDTWRHLNKPPLQQLHLI
ncbi:heterokaryon incompatibility protein-domain-containing protein [Paraphoma chrysanthemicola]|nr:heterokaryon incompatibility protein-domain-containing protein [Paraphoma chrysanthemicola]